MFCSTTILCLYIFGLDFSKITFAIYTVINTTDNGKVNNPPNPPYINLNDLIHTLNVKSKFHANYRVNLEKSLISIFLELSKFKFYAGNNDINKEKLLIINENFTSKDPTVELLVSAAKKIIDIISSNNASTLIGSIESTDILQNTTFTKYPCAYNKNIDIHIEEPIAVLDAWDKSHINYAPNINKILDDDTANLEQYTY
jgi:hypothetical protein